MANYQLQRGTYDAYYEDALNIEKIVSILKRISKSYGYAPIHTPMYEQTALFARSAGETSDIVTKEMFNFLDKSGRDICLRPELTAGVMRAIVTNKLYATKDLPLKLSYYGSAFRYERPQAGRYRQFNQFGIENVGATSYLNDAETIIFGYNSLRILGFPHIILKINSIGDEESRNAYRTALKEFFQNKIENMCPDCKRRFETNPLRILDCKVKEDQEIIKGAPKMSDYLNEQSKEYLNNILKVLDEQGVEYEIDDTLVRGLDYYSHVVFEYHFITENGTSLGAVGAGGHYDNLLREVGGPQLSSVGLAFGVERLNLLLKEINPEEYAKVELDAYLICLGKENLDKVFSLCTTLRNNGFNVDMSFENKSMGASFKIATRKNAKFALIIGENEIANNIVKLKDLNTQEQCDVSLENLVEVLDEKLVD
ncbi:MAG: histidine--tRNA ligase [Erysipelotrichaceae bacterium]|nr:histidine--tRNA ligase [Erysipelotrichaceae bacterium]